MCQQIRLSREHLVERFQVSIGDNLEFREASIPELVRKNCENQAHVLERSELILFSDS